MTDPTPTRSGLTRQQFNTLGLSALGGALEFYDFVIYVFFAQVMGTLFFPPDMPEWLRLVQTFGIFAAGYLARPLGGILMAHYGDLVGRKRMFMLSIVMMAVPTLLIGLLPTYAQIGVLAPVLLLLLRILQGAAIGGEAPGAWVFVSEHVSPRHRNLACGSLSAGLLGGILIGSLVARALNASVDVQQLQAWGWRLPFVIGGVLGLLAMWLRRKLHETPVFVEMRQRRALAAELPLRTVLRAHRGGIVITMLLTWLLTAAVVVTVLMMPTLLQGFGIDRGQALGVNSATIAMAMLGNLLFGWLGDRHGAGKVLALCCVLLGVLFWLGYTQAMQHAGSWPWWCALGGLGLGLTAFVPAIAVSQFPPAVRFSGLSFGYNVAYAICGGLTPVLIALAIKDHPLAPAQYIIAMSLLGVALAIWTSRRAARRDPASESID